MFINGMFWPGMYPFAIINLWGKMGFIDIVIPIMEHAVPLMLLVIELNVNNIVIWNYSYLPVLFSFLVVYLVVNVNYTLKVKPIYPMINYHNLLSIIFIVSCVLVVPICGFIARRYCYYCKEKRVKTALGVFEDEASEKI